ncbi:Dynein light chain 2, cytoplasmic (Dynein light chain LC8-type 2), putative [Schistosoma mansoni]|uniref:Dynein light chain 2, cytoplasmic (Dynein light chain LC8-type 2), putative n=1 Tax=Schistosoma mansoni TaxID=6183 RepID=UPI0001A630F8|nr:Dynein light chain 2, cytoplasmic (Dynein light chain LC8-type 2), putative [Schistosoma mansoni]|eukprot:XP_018646678.1 Dynein light chain 2, cytoplasmic (Dynein light chain LC8-type 2), putative [Schistosoma mansoni]
MPDDQTKIIMAYMPKDMENNAINWFTEAYSTYTTFKDMADYLKQKFDHIYGRNWQCVIGRDFESLHCIVEEKMYLAETDIIISECV